LLEGSFLRRQSRKKQRHHTEAPRLKEHKEKAGKRKESFLAKHAKGAKETKESLAENAKGAEKIRKNKKKK
jgi:hypothetical protein